METQSIIMPRAEARTLYREYRKHLHYSKPIDRECMRAYQLLAQGRLVIKAIESVVKAGLNKEGLPKLALCRAHAPACFLRLYDNGSAMLASIRYPVSNNQRDVIMMPPGSFPQAPRQYWQEAEALVPGIPLHLRPQRGLANYHILWEAEWTRIPPADPYLLRRIGKADLWLVVAAWNLTEVERAALATRIATG
jgi:hypothetical protein